MTRPLDLLEFMWEMESLESLAAREEIRGNLGQPRFRNAGSKFFQGAPDQRAEPALGKPFGQGIDRGDSIQVNRAFQSAVNHLRFGVIHRPRLRINQLAKD